MLSDISVDFSVRHGIDIRDPLASKHPWYVLMELSSSRDDARAALESILAQGLDDGIVDDAVIAASLSQRQAFWKLRDEMSAAQKPEGGSIKHDISVPVAAVPDFIAEANAAVVKLIPGARPVPFGHLGDGNIHYNVSQPVGADAADFLGRWHEVNAVVFAIVLRMGGSISAEHGIGVLKRDELPEVKDKVAIELMRGIKAMLDPLGHHEPRQGAVEPRRQSDWQGISDDLSQSRIRVKNVRVLSDSHYTLRTTTFEWRRANGEWQTQHRETYDRGNGATLLPYNLAQRTVVLVRQFRYPAFVSGYDDLLIEAAAGLLDNETPEMRIRAEAEEETGYRLGEIRKIFEAFMSPGAVTEKLHFFVAEYEPRMRVGSGGGIASEGEEIEVLELPIDQALAMIGDGRIADAKTIMLLQYAALNIFR